MNAWTPAMGSSGGQPPLIGLTGAIGCGKSTVARMLAELGGAVIDADELARQVTAPGAPALGRIRERFGAGVLDEHGDLDRAVLARIVFDDQAALTDLEAMVHPGVRRLVEAELELAAAAEAPFVVIEAIKLVEGGLAERCDEVWLVECEPATQRARLGQRGTEPADIERRMAAQGADLAQRLGERLGARGRLRRLSSERSLKEVRAVVEDALADFLSGALDIG